MTTPTGGPADPGDEFTAYRKLERELVGRWPESMPKPSLARISALMDLLGSPQRSYPVIHLTGTNGKTSTARMIDELLRAFELRTGRYTSPHVHAVRERICVDGEPLSPRRFLDAWEDIAPYVAMVDGEQARRGETEGGLSFFEVLTGMAYAAFADAPVDVAVVEVGLGGAWDATNVVDAPVSVVTPISLDHTGVLGDTTTAIAEEKAGIIKRGAAVVLGSQPIDAAQVLLRRAYAMDATVAREGLEFGVRGRQVAVGGQMLALQGLGGLYEDVFLPLHGAYQAHNAACALAAVEAFFGAGGGSGAARRLNEDTVRAAFARVSSPGRLEVVRRGPTVLLDAAHNPAGARALAEAVADEFAFTHLVGVVSVARDKDAVGILSALEPVLSEVVVTHTAGERAAEVDDLAATAANVFGPERVEVVPRMDDALDTAVRLAEDSAADEGDYAGVGVLVTGSIVTVSEARLLLGASEPAGG